MTHYPTAAPQFAARCAVVAALWVCRVAIAETDVRLRLQSLAILDAVLVVVQMWATAPLRNENNREFWRQFSPSQFLVALTMLSVVLLGWDLFTMVRILLT